MGLLKALRWWLLMRANDLRNWRVRRRVDRAWRKKL
jgi:hypothetical protein